VTARRDAFVDGVLRGGDTGFGATLLRVLLTPLAGLHCAGLEAYLLPFRVGLRRRFRLRNADGSPVPTLAIGNLSSGGTGKTPMAQLVAGHFQESGKRVVLLSRGHGGSGEAGSGPCIVSDGDSVLLGADAAGDEPVLLAQSLPGVPVIVGRDRRQSGRLALATFAPEVVVLDDALQYWQLHRDLDIVLLDARRPLDNGYVLPRGLLREPPSHLARADIVVLTRADHAAHADIARTRARIAALAPRALVFTAIHAPMGWVRASDRALLPLDALPTGRAILFSAIADNDGFRRTVEALGVEIASPQCFPDHHAYLRGEIAALSGAGGSFAVTTEKDLVKAAPLWPAAGPPLYALRIGMKIDDEAGFFARLDKDPS
jgi:tetraacyldisaccharide 4'-kinase